MAAPEERAAADNPSNPELDVKKLHALPSEQQDLYLLTFTSDLARHVASLDADGASAHQIYIKKEIFQIINLASPAPTRVIRNNLGRAIAGIFEKGDRKLLFESINDCIGILNSAGKGDKDIRAKHAAAHCLGAIFEAAGDSAIGLSPHAATSLLRLLKLAQNHTGLRSTLFKAVGRIFKGVGPSADEVVARDAWKQARNACTGERSMLVQTSACYCLEQLVRFTPFFDNSNDFEKLQSVVWKTLESASASVRHTVASCISVALTKNYAENAPVDIPMITRSKTAKKKNKKGTDDGDDEVMERPDSPAPKKSATQLSFTVTSMLRLLSTRYCLPSTGNRGRAGIAVCYMKTLRGLGEQVVQSKYPEIARSLFGDVLSNSFITQNRYRTLSTRKNVAIILETVIGRDMLGESAQLSTGAKRAIGAVQANLDRSVEYSILASQQPGVSDQHDCRFLSRRFAPSVTASKLHGTSIRFRMSSVVCSCLSTPATTCRHNMYEQRQSGARSTRWSQTVASKVRRLGKRALRCAQYVHFTAAPWFRRRELQSALASHLAPQVK
jgi:hypothetical protein